MQEQEKALRYFFRHLVSFLTISGVCILIWLFTGLGYFWPIWPMIFMGIPLFIEAFRLKILPDKCQQRAEQVFNAFPKLTAEYEDNFVKNHESASDSSDKEAAASGDNNTAAKTKTKKTTKPKKKTTTKTSTKKKTTTSSSD